MRIGETPSPPRAGRFAILRLVGEALHPELGIRPAAGKLGEQIERLGQHVVGRHRLERRHVDEGEDLAELQRLRRVGAGCGEAAGVARVEEDRAAVLHERVDLRHRLGGGRRLVGIDRPVEQRVEGELVGGDVDRGGLARLERRAVGEIDGEAVEPGAARLRRARRCRSRHRRAASSSWRRAPSRVARSCARAGSTAREEQHARERKRRGAGEAARQPAGEGEHREAVEDGEHRGGGEQPRPDRRRRLRLERAHAALPAERLRDERRDARCRGRRCSARRACRRGRRCRAASAALGFASSMSATSVAPGGGGARSP